MKLSNYKAQGLNRNKINIYFPTNANLGLVLFLLEFVLECKFQNIETKLYIENTYPKPLRYFYSKYFLRKIGVKYHELLEFSTAGKNLDNSYIHGLRFEKTINWRIYNGKIREINKHNRRLFLRISKINTLLEKSENLDHKWIIPSGSSYSTQEIIKALKEKHIDFLTFDSSFGLISTAINGIAAHNRTGYNSYKMIIEDKIPVSTTLIEKAEEYFLERVNNQDFQIVQRNSIGSYTENYALILLNIDWDSAALIKCDIADNQFEAVTIIVEWLLNNTNYNIIIRRHPNERHWWGKNNMSYSELSKISSRIKILDSNEQINTYDLIENAGFVVGWSSSALLESVILGKRTFGLANSLYTDLGIVIPVSKKTMLDFTYKPDKNISIKTLKVLFYLIQKKGWLESKHTPQDIDLLRRIQSVDNTKFDSNVFSALTDFSESYIHKYLLQEFSK